MSNQSSNIVMDKNKKIKEWMLESYGKSISGDVATIDPDYTFIEFYEDLKSKKDVNARLRITDENVLRSILSKICFQTASKFRFTEDKFYKSLPMKCWQSTLLFETVLKNLTEDKGYRIYAHDTHRWISTDGWYELEYNLQDDNGLDLYITTYSSHEQEFEDEWSSENGHDVSYSEVYYSDFEWTPKYALCSFIENEQVRSDMNPEFVAEIERRFKK